MCVQQSIVGEVPRNNRVLVDAPLHCRISCFTWNTFYICQMSANFSSRQRYTFYQCRLYVHERKLKTFDSPETFSNVDASRLSSNATLRSLLLWLFASKYTVIIFMGTNAIAFATERCGMGLSSTIDFADGSSVHSHVLSRVFLVKSVSRCSFGTGASRCVTSHRNCDVRREGGPRGKTRRASVCPRSAESACPVNREGGREVGT